MINVLNRNLSLGLLFVMLAYAVTVRADSVGEVSITAEQWSRVSSSRQFMAIDGLRNLVLELNRLPGSVLVVHYQGGENGLLLAQQFRNRMVATGLGSSRIQMVQGVPEDFVLVIKIQEG